MLINALLVFLGSVFTVNGEIHSLTYIYTAFSRHVGSEGIHDFTAMGLLDDRMIDYFDSDHQTKVPKQEWMKQRLPDDYWKKGTDSRKSKQQWFNVNIKILMERMQQNDTDLHILQWMHGCKGEKLPDGTLKFRSGMDMYSYDGNNFLSFDDANSVWVAPNEAALQTKRKWDDVQVLKEYTKGYLENECMDWLSKFVNYSEMQLQKAVPPKVYVFAKEGRFKTTITLTCLATGFYPKDIILNIRRNDVALTKDHGLVSSGVRPNGDGTHQQRDSVDILKSDLSRYTCEVIHRATDVHVTMVWDHTLPYGSGSTTIIVGSILVAFVVAVAALLIWLWKRGYFGRCTRSQQNGGFYDVVLPQVSAPAAGTQIPSDAAGNGSGPNNGMTIGLLAEKGSDNSLDSKKSGSDSGVSSDGNGSNKRDP